MWRKWLIPGPARPGMASTALQKSHGGVLAAKCQSSMCRGRGSCLLNPHCPPKTGTHRDGTSHTTEGERQGGYPILLIWEPNSSNHVQQPSWNVSTVDIADLSTSWRQQQLRSPTDQKICAWSNLRYFKMERENNQGYHMKMKTRSERMSN